MADRPVRRVKPTPRKRTPTSEPEKRADHRRDLDEVFGDVLPDSTRDERGEEPDPSRDDDLLGDVPPHHG